MPSRKVAPAREPSMANCTFRYIQGQSGPSKTITILDRHLNNNTAIYEAVKLFIDEEPGRKLIPGTIEVRAHNHRFLPDPPWTV